MTPKDYQDALLSQSACNLSGLLASLERIRPRIWEECQGTKEFNEHPIIRLYAEQIAYLSSGRDYSDAYSVCEQMAKEGT